MTGEYQATFDPPISDPARTLENGDQEVTIEATGTELVPLNVGDRCCLEIMTMMVMHEWDGRKSARDIAIRYGISEGAAMSRASEAGRHLRIQRAPDALFEFAMARTRQIAEEDDGDRMAALRTIFEQIENVAKRLGNRPQDKLSPEQERERLGALLDDPPPALVEILEAKGWKK